MKIDALTLYREAVANRLRILQSVDATVEFVFAPASMATAYNVAIARQLVETEDATHACGDWLDAGGKCELCDRVWLEPDGDAQGQV